MSLFRCTECGHVENTAVSNYVVRRLERKPPLCSQCDPEIGKWHGRFKRFKPEEEGLVEAPDGYLYDPSDRYYKEQMARKDASEKSK